MSTHLPRLGEPVVFRPRVPHGRQYEMAAQVARVWDAATGDVDLIIFPAGGEPFHVSHAVPASERVKIHCWVSVEDPRISALEDRIDEMWTLLEEMTGGPRKGANGVKKSERSPVAVSG